MIEIEERARSEGTENMKRFGERFSRLDLKSELRRIDASPGAIASSVAMEARSTTSSSSLPLPEKCRFGVG